MAGDVWKFPTLAGRRFQDERVDHPTQKPVDLMRRPILNHTKRGELVYEPFLGSGTTLAAAELTQRVCCGIWRRLEYTARLSVREYSIAGSVLMIPY